MNTSKDIPDMTKGLASICYNIDCNDPATTVVKLPINERLSCVVYVCGNCLSKYPKHKESDSACRGRGECAEDLLNEVLAVNRWNLSKSKNDNLSCHKEKEGQN
jgi:hypothetical protein